MAAGKERDKPPDICASTGLREKKIKEKYKRI
jgi:hypothetical protein